MKTSAWIVATGLALGFAGLAAEGGVSRAMGAPMGDEKVDLTPRFKTGQTMRFTQHAVRKDTMILGGMPMQTKPEEKPAGGGGEGKDAPSSPAKGETPKGDAPKPEAPKGEPIKDAKPATVPSSAGGGMSSTTAVDQTATFELRVVEAGDQGVSLELELKKVVATGDLPGGKFSWDSSAPPQEGDAKNPIAAAFRPIVGAVVKIKMGSDGSVTSVEPDSRAGAVGGGPLAVHAQGLVGADGVRLRWASVLWIKDGREPATVGQSWPNTDETLFRGVGKFRYITTNALKSVKEGMASIEIAGTIELAGLEAGSAPAGAIKDQSLKGSCVWDTKTGQVKSHAWEQKQSLDINARGFAVTRTTDLVVTTTRE